MILQVAKRTWNIRFDREIENKNFGQGGVVISQRRFDLKDYTKTILLFIAAVAFAYSARTAHPFQRNGAPFRFKLSKAQQVD